MTFLRRQYQPLHSSDNDLHIVGTQDEADHAAKRLNVLGNPRVTLTNFTKASSVRRPRFSLCCLAISLTLSIILVILLGGGAISYKSTISNGESPAWYPTPRGGTLDAWKESYEKAEHMVKHMSLPEKVNITTGTGWAMDLCVGVTGSALASGFPSLCLQDGPLGLRFADGSTSFPAGITVGATWNRDLMRRRGVAHGREARLKGINVILGPSMGSLGRNPAGGRNWEGFGADPVLQAIAASETIKGIQSQGVMATAKHFIGNEQEHFRKSFEWGLPEAMSSNIDDRTLHEIYAWPFAEAVRAGVASVMCAYQMVNNSYACQNSKLMNGILKDELGFQGFVMSDWLAQRSGVASALAGLDMSMPGDGLHWMDGRPLFGDQLTIAVLNESVPIKRLDDMALRIVAAWYQLGQDSWNVTGPNFSSWTHDQVGKLHNAASNSHERAIVNKFVMASDKESRQIAREVAAEGTILLKNDGILPLQRDLSNLAVSGKRRVMIIGEDAGPGNGPNYCADRACNQGTLAVGWGSGATEFMYLVDPASALNNTFDHDNVEVTVSLTNAVDRKTAAQLQQQDLCLVFANADGGEGYLAWNGVRADRPDLELQKDGTRLIKTVAHKCGGPTVIVIHAVGPVILEDFADLPQVKAIIFANLPGQESGHALADVVFGKVDASGRLAFTIGRSLNDYGKGGQVLYYPNHIIPQVSFDERLYIDYRHFDKHDINPRYPFGHGLSYTEFELSELVVTELMTRTAIAPTRPLPLTPPNLSTSISDPSTALFPSGFFRLKKYIYSYIESTKLVKKGKYPYPDGYESPQMPSLAGGGLGGNPSLFEPVIQVSLKVENIGSRAGKSVIQLYLAYPQSIFDGSEVIDFPPWSLRNFEKIELTPSESGMIIMNLTRKDLSYWSSRQQNWILPTNGKYQIGVGFSSRDLQMFADF